MMTFNGHSVKEAVYNTRPLGAPGVCTVKETLGVAASLRLHWPEYLMEAGEMSLFVFCWGSLATLLQHPASPVRHFFVSGIVRRALMGLADRSLKRPKNRPIGRRNEPQARPPDQGRERQDRQSRIDHQARQIGRI